MRNILSFILIIGLLAVSTSCGTSPLSGSPVTYYNSAKTFSISLPVSDEKDWLISEDADGSLLNIAHASDTIRIQIQRLPKGHADHMVSDLDSYQDYAIINTFSELLSSIAMQDTQIAVPDFITASTASVYNYSDAKGFVVFMESTACYYTYLVMAVDEVYDANETVLLESAASLRESVGTP